MAHIHPDSTTDDKSDGTETVRWLRDLDAESWIDLVVVSAVTAVLVIRGALALSGYPQVGNDTLHVAHVLWGGMLMLVALLLAVGLLGRRVRPFVAVIGGLGFGTFIDEVGKFVTQDNDYFFRPAIAIIYAILVATYLVARSFVRRMPPRPQDHLANALRDLEEWTVDDLDDEERRRILRHLEHADPDDPIVRSLRHVVASVPTVGVRRPGRLTRWRRALASGYRNMARSRWFARGLIAFFVVEFLVSVVVLSRLVFDAWSGTAYAALPRGAVEWGLTGGAVASDALVALGIHSLVRGDRMRALRRFQASVLVTLLIVQVFQFHLEQWSALAGLAFQLAVLGALRYAIEHDPDRDPGAFPQALG